jgi:hypothetical protein
MIACRALAQGDYTHRHNQVANIVHQELALKRGLSNGPPMLCYKYEPQSVLENIINCTMTGPYHLIELSITTDQIYGSYA